MIGFMKLFHIYVLIVSLQYLLMQLIHRISDGSNQSKREKHCKVSSSALFYGEYGRGRRSLLRTAEIFPRNESSRDVHGHSILPVQCSRLNHGRCDYRRNDSHGSNCHYKHRCQLVPKCFCHWSRFWSFCQQDRSAFIRHEHIDKSDLFRGEYRMGCSKSGTHGCIHSRLLCQLRFNFGVG